MGAFIETLTALDFLYAALVRHEGRREAQQIHDIDVDGAEIDGEPCAHVPASHVVEALSRVHDRNVSQLETGDNGNELQSRRQGTR